MSAGCALGVISLAPLLLPGCIEAGAFYYPASSGAATPAGFEEVRFPTAGGLTLHGWFIPARHARPKPAPTVLHVHGNAGDVSNHRYACEFLADRGFNVLLFDYRGYGASDAPRARLGRAPLVEDTHAALDYLLTRDDVDQDRIAVFGYSLGAVLGLAVAAERPEIRAVVEYAGFSSWKGVAADRGGFVGRMLIAGGFDATDSAAALGDRPLLIVHGARDRIVDYRHAGVIRDAAEGAGVRVEFLAIEDGDHISIGEDPRVRDTVDRFLRRELGLTDSAGG